jgi:hypothetical protein
MSEVRKFWWRITAAAAFVAIETAWGVFLGTIIGGQAPAVWLATSIAVVLVIFAGALARNAYQDARDRDRRQLGRLR